MSFSSESQIFQEIADNARAALDCPGTQVYSYDSTRDEIQVVAWSGLQLEPSQRAMRWIKLFFPSFAPLEYRNSASLNPFLKAVYHDGQVKTASFVEGSQNVAPALAVQLASVLAGMRFMLAAPIKIEGAVVGAVAFLQSPKFSTRNIRTCEAFARQASLLLENARLSQNLSLQLFELERSRRLLTENEERVRREISEMLHTRVQTRLLIAAHRLGSYKQLEDEAARTALIEQISRDLDQIREEDVRDASHMLHPAVIRIGLMAAVRSLAARFGQTLEVNVHSDEAFTTVDDMNGQLEENLRLVAYRVIEEAISNILRHAKASVVQINLSFQNQTLEIRVMDNGIGFDASQFKTGLGLSSLDARVLSVGGTWEILSNMDEHTELIARIPL